MGKVGGGKGRKYNCILILKSAKNSLNVEAFIPQELHP